MSLMVVNPFMGGFQPLLLDLLSVAPVVAYSTRKLRAAYTGYALTVQRSSDSAILDIGFVNGELDSATLLSFVGGSTGLVYNWYNQALAGGGTQASVATPYISSGGVTTKINGKAAPFFSNGKYLFTNKSIGGTVLSGLYVAQITSAGGTAYGRVMTVGSTLGSDWTTTANAVMLSKDNFNANVRVERNSAGTPNAAVGYDTGFHAATIFDGSNMQQYVNGTVTGAAVASTGTFVVNQIFMGGNLDLSVYWNGPIGESILFDSALGSTDRAAAYANQKAYWGTP